MIGRHFGLTLESRGYQEAVEKSVDELGGVVDALGVLSDDPDHGRPRLGLVQRLQVVAERGDGALVPVGVPSIMSQFTSSCQSIKDLFGYFRKMSLSTTVASCTTWLTRRPRSLNCE